MSRALPRLNSCVEFHLDTRNILNLPLITISMTVDSIEAIHQNSSVSYYII